MLCWKKLLQGKWEVTEVVFDGTATDNLKGVQAVFDKDKLSLIGGEGKREFSIKLDPTKNPKAIDMTALDGEFKGDTNPAIYQLEGDTLKLCMSNEPGNNKRPTELASKEGSKLLLMTLKRSIKGGNKDDKELLLNGAGGDPKTDLARIQGSWKGIKLEACHKSKKESQLWREFGDHLGVVQKRAVGSAKRQCNRLGHLAPSCIVASVA